MRLFIYQALAIALASDLDVFEMIDGARMNEQKGNKMKTLKCGECGGTATPMTSTHSGHPLFWWQCNNKKCSVVSEAVTKKKKSYRKWNQLSMLVAELKERKWTV